MADSGTFTGIGVEPHVSSASVVSDKVIRVQYDEAMFNNAGLVNAAYYTFTKEAGSKAIVAQSVSAEAVTYPTYVDVTVDVSLTDGTSNYHVEVTAYATSGIKDSGTNPLNGSFRTATFNGSGPNPQVVSAAALDFETIRVTFNRDMNNDAELIDAGNYTFVGDTTITASTVTYVNATHVNVIVTGEMHSSLTPNYTLTVALAVNDASYNTMDPWARTATFAGVGVAPRVSSASMPNFETVIVGFNEDMDTSRMVPGDFVITGPTTPTVSVIIWSDATHAQLTVPALTEGGAYTVTVSNVEDEHGNPIDPLFNSYGFTAVSKPQVQSATAQDSETVRVTFNEKMKNEAALTLATNYGITGDTSVTINSVIVVGGSDYHSVDLDVTEMLNYGQYTVEVNNVHDDGDNPIDTLHNTADFEGKGIQPQVTSASMPDYLHIVVLFDEDMDTSRTVPTDFVITGPTTVSVSVIAWTDATHARLTTSELRDAGSYTVTVSNVTDTADNVVDPDHDTASFSGVGVLPQVSSAAAATQALISVVFNKALVDNAALRLPANYVFTGATTLTAVSALPVLGHPEQVRVTITGDMVEGTANYTVTVNSAITDTLGNGIDPAHNSATFDGMGIEYQLPVLAHYPPDGSVEVSPREPLRVKALGPYPSPGLVETTWNIQLSYSDGTATRTLDFLTNGVPNGSMFTYDKLGDASDQVSGVTYRFLPRSGLWMDNVVYTLYSEISDAESATTTLSTTVQFAESVCFEDNVPARSEMDAKILTELTSYPSCDYIRKLLLSVCTGAANKTVQARTVLWHSASTDLAAVAALVFDPALVRNITLCDRTPVITVHAALQECWPTLLLAYDEIRKVVGNSFGTTIENYLKSNSSVYVVNAAACIVVLAAQSQAQVP